MVSSVETLASLSRGIHIGAPHHPISTQGSGFRGEGGSDIGLSSYTLPAYYTVSEYFKQNQSSGFKLGIIQGKGAVPKGECRVVGVS